jgi:O-acetyl-ADP-ribose deacetylase (regulator of RNase III)
MPQSARARIRCVRGDITVQAVDAIVNAASSALRGGGGVDGAIHRAAGPGLLAECIERHPGGCPTGEARITGGYRLAARYVIHAVGPVWRGGGHGERDLLASAYQSALALAASERLETVAFPAISCGAYGYPREQAARVAVSALALGLEQHPIIREVRMVLFDDELFELFDEALGDGARA